MRYRSDNLYLSIYSFIFIVIIIALFGISYTMTYKNPEVEAYTNSVASGATTTPSIMSKRHIYFQIGLQTFFTSFDKTAERSYSDFLEWIQQNENLIYFYPNRQDICCQSDHDDCDCDNLDIRLSSLHDTSLVWAPQYRINSIENGFGAMNPQTCMMSLLGNEYILHRKTVMLPVESVDVIQRKSARDTYRITLRETDLGMFVLLRPLLLSFSGANLFAVLHEDYDTARGVQDFEDKKDRNMFSYFHTARSSPPHMLVHHMKNVSGLFHGTDSGARVSFKNLPQRLPCTLYYLTFVREIPELPYGYVINFHLHTHSMMTEDEQSIVIAPENEGDERFMQKIVFTHKKQRGVQLRIDDEMYTLPEEFDTDDMRLKTHDIIITVAFDTLIMLCLGRYSDATHPPVMSMKRHHLKKKLRCEKKALHESYRQQAPSMYTRVQHQWNPCLALTAVPNYAVLAYHMGYSF